MAVDGSYLAMQVRLRALGPVRAFAECIFHDVVPAFENLDKRADEVANEYYNRIGSQSAGEYEDVDMADVAEAATERSLSWYQMMVALRQSMLNLLASGLFHLAEQRLADLCRDGSFHIDPPHDSKLADVSPWYREHFGLDLAALPSWSVFDELRLVANAVKHAEGSASSATRQLRQRRVEFFSNPDYAEIYKEYQEAGIAQTFVPVLAPLSGGDLFVNEALLRMYAESAESFFRAVAQYFETNGERYFPT
jgi:hypothetical protein